MRIKTGIPKLKAIFSYRLGRLYQFAPRKILLPQRRGLSKPLHGGRLKFSIVTPSFMQGNFIERTILSVLSQDYVNREYFVQDGASSDCTKDILQKYSKYLDGWDSAIDKGQSHAINLGFAKTSGDIMGWLNSDDILFPGALSFVATFFEKNPDVDVIYGHRILIDEDDCQIGRWILPPHEDEVLSWADYIPQETLFWRRSLWDRVGGGVDETFRFAMDWDLIIRFREAGGKFKRLPRVLGGFRVHSLQKTSAEISTAGIAEMQRIRERIHGRIPSDHEISAQVMPYLRRHIWFDLAWRIREQGIRFLHLS
jgi:glycosyltransferase involved in cell wall biosynthesis